MKLWKIEKFESFLGFYLSYMRLCGFLCFKFPLKTFSVSFFGASCTFVHCCVFSFLCLKSVYAVVNKDFKIASIVFVVGMNLIECTTTFFTMLCLVLSFYNRKEIFKVTRAFLKFNKLVRKLKFPN